MVLIEYNLNIPLDIVVFMNGWMRQEPLNDKNIQEAVNLWCENKEECLFKFGNIKYWDTTNITNMRELFYCKRNFNEDISHWNVSKVRDMSGMFYHATSFNGDISNWNVSNVRTMKYMFCGATLFNSDLTGWNVSNGRDMGGMFKGASSFDRVRYSPKFKTI